MRLDGSKRTAEGYIDTYGNLTRTGVFEYRRADGSIQRELRLPEDVFAPAAIASMNGQPLTLTHPSRNIDSRTFRDHAVGVVLEPHKADDGIHLRARVRVMDEEACQAVERGTKELSNGYSLVLEPIPGGVFRRDDFNGGVEVRADYRQTEILNNHTALVDRGRAGPTARLDSAGNEEFETMMTAEEKKALEDAQAALAAEKQRADTAIGKIAAYEAEEKRRADEAAAKAKQELVDRVAPIVKKDAAELGKLDESELMRQALGVMQPKMKFDGWNAAMLRGAFETALVAEASRTDTASNMAIVVGAARQVLVNNDAEDENASERAFQKQRADAASGWKPKK